MEPYRIRFLKSIFELAGRCNYPISDFEFSLYEKTLEPFGFENCCIVMESILAENNCATRLMPSCSFIATEVMSHLKMKSAEKSDVASTIIRSFRNNGQFYPTKPSFHPYSDFETSYKARYGHYAWIVLRRLGGYLEIFESWQASQSQENFLLKLRRSIEANRLEIENELAAELALDDAQTHPPIETELASAAKVSN